MAKRIVDLLFTAMVFVGSIYLWLAADKFPVFAKYKNVDSDFWPKIILVCIGILSILILYENIAALRASFRGEREGPSGCDRETASSSVNWTKMILMGLLCIAYYWGLHFLGFFMATILFMWLAMAVIGGAKRVMAIVFPIVFTSVLAIVFVKLLELSLPRGMGIFHELSLFFY